MQYRSGTTKGAELVYPEQKQLSKDSFTLFHIQFIRSGAYGISFKLGGFEYSLEYLAQGPDPKDDQYQLLVEKDPVDTEAGPTFEDYCDKRSISGRSAFYPLDKLSKRMGVSVRETTDDGN